MPLFPALDIEEKVQENDKTRLNASKSFVSGGTTLALIKIKPSAAESYVQVGTTSPTL